MSARVELNSNHLPAWLLIVLALCVSGLAAHFALEALSPLVSWAAAGQTPQGGQAYPGGDPCEDNFVFLLTPNSRVQFDVLPATPPEIVRPASTSILPLLPPPNA
jgi:hypothetical protein